MNLTHDVKPDTITPAFDYSILAHLPPDSWAAVLYEGNKLLISGADPDEVYSKARTIDERAVLISIRAMRSMLC